MAWIGPVFWPFAYADLFNYTFWPWGYDNGYWPYAYDDFYNGIFFPYGAPYAGYADPDSADADSDAGPYDNAPSVSITPLPGHTIADGGSITIDAPLPGQISQSAKDLCNQPDSGVTAWPFDRIQKAVAPIGEQQASFDALRDAAAKAAARFKEACPRNVPMTPPGRLLAITGRLQATLDAVKLVRPALAAFYDSLSDEQKARFNALGPSGDQGHDQSAVSTGTDNRCDGDKSGLTAFPIARMRDEIDPTGEQGQRLDGLSKAMDDSVKTLEAACPDDVPLTPVGRLDAMQNRLEAMIKAAAIIKPALEDFYASLSDEQKARFNQLGRQAANVNVER